MNLRSLANQYWSRTWAACITTLLLPVWLAGCLAKPSGPAQTGIAPASTLPVTTPLSQPAPSQTPVLAQVETAASPTIEPLPTQSTPFVDPLRFTFPTAAAEAATIWRPPLYPIPWEPTPQDHFYFSRPIGANEVNWPLARYRYGGIFFENTIHTGIDIPAPNSTPIMAAGPGTVIWAGWGLFFLKEEFSDPYGVAVAIKHDFGYNGSALYTVYGHMERHFVTRGQRVEAGELIGLVGETGKVTGPHLHFEVRVGDNTYYKTRNPELWIAPPQGWGVLAAQVQDSDGVPLMEQTVNIRSLDTNQYWSVITYGGKAVNSDAYYRENMVIGDLPAGKYVTWIEYDGTVYDQEVEIQPGLVTYFRFVGKFGYEMTRPPVLGPDFTPPEVITTSLNLSTLDK